MFIFVFVIFVLVVMLLLFKPWFWGSKMVPTDVDLIGHRKQLLKEQVLEAEENSREDFVSSELKDELGLIYLLEEEQQTKKVSPNSLGDGGVFQVFLGIAFALILVASLSYWTVGGQDVLEVVGAEELLGLDAVKDSVILRGWVGRLTHRVGTDEKDGKSWYLLGHAHLKLGEYQRAAEAFSNSNLWIARDINVLSYWLQARYLQFGSLDAKSLGIIETILEIDGGHVAAREVLGVDALRKGDAVSAVSELSKAISSSDNPTRQSVLATLVAEARKTFEGNASGIYVTTKAKSEVPLDSTIFIVARPVGGGMPYAVVKRPARMLPFKVVLDDLVSMQSARALSSAESFEVVVRVSDSGRIGGSDERPAWISDPLSKTDYIKNIEINANI